MLPLGGALVAVNITYDENLTLYTGGSLLYNTIYVYNYL